jgi:hypothetical protein
MTTTEELRKEFEKERLEQHPADWYLGADPLECRESGGASWHYVRWLEARLIEAEGKHAEEVERLVWNLAGCDTYAMGYGLEKDHDKAFALPALESVRRLALKEQSLRTQLSALTLNREKELKEAIGFAVGWMDKRAGNERPYPSLAELCYSHFIQSTSDQSKEEPRA